MSTEQKTTSGLDLLLKILGTANATTPIAVSGVTSIINLIKGGRETGKSDAEIEAEAADSMETALRTRQKSEDQMSDRA